MARRSPQSVLKRAREQAMREKRELKQAKKDARAAERRRAADPEAEAIEGDGAADLEAEAHDGDAAETPLDPLP
jgi:hypothetical protein